MRRFALIGLLTAAGAAWSQDLPPAPRSGTQADLAACRAAGGEPRLTEGYATAADLNADGTEDWVIDLAGLDCAGTGEVFCGEGGCPVAVWISGAGGHLAAWRGRAEGWRIEGGALLLERSGAVCPDGTGRCEERLAFAEGAGGAPSAPAASDRAPPGDAETPPEGWTLRAVPGRGPVAVGGGAGTIESLAAFCLARQPWLAIDFASEPAGEAAAMAFHFSEQEVATEARREDSAGGAYVIALDGQPLAELLAGRDASVPVTVDGAPQGALSLKGSTRAIRAALDGCR